jgi:hypothetical protein
LKERRIRVNAVSPGSIDTPGLSDLLASSETGQQRLTMISTGVPLGGLGTPDAIAKAVVFLASDDSSYITGAERRPFWIRRRVVFEIAERIEIHEGGNPIGAIPRRVVMSPPAIEWPMRIGFGIFAPSIAASTSSASRWSS